MSISAHDVARELRSRLGGRLGGWKLHKLLYYCQGWHLALTESPMFRERIEAWDQGPVVASLWRAEKYGDHHPTPQELTESMRATVDLVLSRYGQKSGPELVDLTHKESPWIVARDLKGQNAELRPTTLARFFSVSALAERVLDDPALRTRLRQAVEVSQRGPADIDTHEAVAARIASFE